MSQEPAPVDRSATPSTAESPDMGATRRGLLLGTGIVGLTGALAACGNSEGGEESSEGGGSGAQPGGNDQGLAQTSEIPVGGGKVFKEQGVVVTQPKEGVWRAFSTKCTHRGCDVDKVAGGTIQCPCHGSKFTIGDAGVTGGPAKGPLEAKKITVEGGWIKLA